MGINTVMNTDGKPFSIAASNNNGNRHKSIKLSKTALSLCSRHICLLYISEVWHWILDEKELKTLYGYDEQRTYFHLSDQIVKSFCQIITFT